MSQPFGYALRLKREQNTYFTTDVLADYLEWRGIEGFSHELLAQIECGEAPPPDENMIDILAMALNCTEMQRLGLREAARASRHRCWRRNIERA